VVRWIIPQQLRVTTPLGSKAFIIHFRIENDQTGQVIQRPKFIFRICPFRVGFFDFLLAICWTITTSECCVIREFNQN
jgi:hypothetical protein